MAVDTSQLVAAVQRFAAQTVDGSGRLAVTYIKGDHRVPRETGELVGSVVSRGLVEASGTRFTVRVSAPVLQAATTDKGARPHPIVPRRPGGLLVFNWPKAGGTVFLRSVNHPGNRAMNWWEPTVRDAFRIALPQAARAATF